MCVSLCVCHVCVCRSVYLHVVCVPGERFCVCIATFIQWCVCYASVQCICVHIEDEMGTQCMYQRFNPWRHDTCTESLVHKLT